MIAKITETLVTVVTGVTLVSFTWASVTSVTSVTVSQTKIENMKTTTPSECMRSLADIADHLYVTPLPAGDTARELWMNARALTGRVQSLMVNPDEWETLAGFNDIAEQVVDALRELC
ncbi:MAG: hypothetical protein WCH57_08795 [Verrucomicrobiota bacterium]